MTLTIGQLVDQAELPTIRAMFREYADSMGLDLEFQNFSEELAGLPGKYAPPSGCILLARVDHEPAGCVALRPLGDGVCEMKRLYVRPALPRPQIGSQARGANHPGGTRPWVRTHCALDTIASRMGDAVALYRALGFRVIPPYCDNPYPDGMFMELSLTG